MRIKSNTSEYPWGSNGRCDDSQLILVLPAESTIIWALPFCIGSLNLAAPLLKNTQNFFPSNGFKLVEDEETSGEIENTLHVLLYNSLSS